MILRVALSIGLALLLAAFSAAPAGQHLERAAGLSLLYTLRGDREPPKEAVIVALDAHSIAWLQRNAGDLESVANGLDDCLTRHAIGVLKQTRSVKVVPRALYICLLRQLHDRDARLVVFDINFNADKPDDGAFAAAIAALGNVLLFERVTTAGVIRRLKPAKILEDAALGSVAFQTDGGGGAIATGYPTVLAQAPNSRIMPLEVWRRYTDAPETDTPAGSNVSGSTFQHVWYYGPPATIPTYSLRDVFDLFSTNPLPEDLSQTAVFIGVSDREKVGAEDHFRMPGFYAEPAMIGGVEIAATAFLNLLHEHRLVSPTDAIKVMIVFGVTLALIATGLCLSGPRSLLAVSAIAVCYIGICSIAFSQGYIWLPVSAPIVVGLPATILVFLFYRYATARLIVNRLAPPQIGERLLQSIRIDRGQSSIEESTVLFIDIENSTSLGERIETSLYQIVMNVFYDTAATAIEAHDGMIVDFKGDGLLALFNETIAGPNHAAKACQAAFDVSAGVRRADLGHVRGTPVTLRLRFGIHTGTVATGVTGSKKRYNFNAIGDSVNTASRLEQYGKIFSNDAADVILISDETRRRAGISKDRAEFIAETRLRGKAGKIQIYRVFADRNS